MKKLSKVLALVLALIMCFSSLTLILAGCGGDENDKDDNSPSGTNTSTDTGAGTNTDTGTGTGPSAPGKVDHTIQIKTLSGMAVSGVTLVAYQGENIKGFGTTDKNGLVTLSLEKDILYTVKIDSAPAGYKFNESYTMNQTGLIIETQTSVVENPDLTFPDEPYKLGDVMYDFEVTTITGETLKLSEILETKKMVLLNFFFTNCQPCATEFPYMISAYEQFKDDIEIISINPYPGEKENEANTKLYANSMGLTFPVVKEGVDWSTAFGVKNYPTNIIIDRDGMICFRDEGAMTSQTPLNLLFTYFTKPDGQYKQQLITTLDQVAPSEKPNVEMPSSSEIGEAINMGDITIEYFPEDDEMAWPFIIQEAEDGSKYIFTANSGKLNSYAQINATVTLKAGDVLAFDYFSNTESNEDTSDILYVFVEGKDIFQILGVSSDWKTCYPFVAESDGEYEINLCYLKNEVADKDPSDDGIMIKNMRITTVDEIDEPTYISRYAATQKNENGFGYNKYAQIVMGDDGFYRVGDKNGPYLLVELINSTQFAPETSVTIMAYSGELDSEISEKLLVYCNYASNSKFYGLCAVDETLKNLLIKVTDKYGYDPDPNEWLQMCEYYSAYGTEEQLENPIKGLGTVSAYDAYEGEDNYVEYDRPIMPKGLLYKFVPTKTGVYRITSDSEHEVLGWIFLGDKSDDKPYASSDVGERLGYVHTGNDINNCTMVAYMEAGKSYYIDIAYYDVYQVGRFSFSIEYIAEKYAHFIEASPGPFTFEEGENFDPDTLQGIGETIAGGVDVVLYEGYYYVLNSDGTRGSKLYADFLFPTNIFQQNIQELIKAKAFEFHKTSEDQTVIAYNSSFEVQYICDQFKKALIDEFGEEIGTKKYEVFAEVNRLVDTINGKYYVIEESATPSKNDSEILEYIESFKKQYGEDKVLEGFKAMWGEYYDELSQFYMVEDVMNGVYHKEVLTATPSNQELVNEIESYRAQFTVAISITYFQKMWGADYEENAAIYKLEETLNGTYHGMRITSANDDYILGLIEEYKSTYGEDEWRQGFKALWGAEYENNYVNVYKVDEVVNGIYHGNGLDLTAEISEYIDKMITEETHPVNYELHGCVEVDEKLGEILQLLMDKFTFEGVEHSWTKLCYYYNYLGGMPDAE